MAYLSAKKYFTQLFQHKELLDWLWCYRDKGAIPFDEIYESGVLSKYDDAEDVLAQLEKDGLVMSMNGTWSIDLAIRNHLEVKLGAYRRPDATAITILEVLQEEVGYFIDLGEKEKYDRYPKLIVAMQGVKSQVEVLTETLSLYRDYITTIENPKEKFTRLRKFNVFLENVLVFFRQLTDFLAHDIDILLNYKHEQRQYMIGFVRQAKRSIRVAQEATAKINDDIIDYIHRYVRNAAFYRKVNRIAGYIKNGTLEAETDLDSLVDKYVERIPEFRIFRKIDPLNVVQNPLIDDMLLRVANMINNRREEKPEDLNIPATDGVPEREDVYQVMANDIWKTFVKYAGKHKQVDLCGYIMSLKFEVPVSDTEIIAFASEILGDHLDELTIEPRKGIRKTYSRIYDCHYFFEYPILTLKSF